MLAHRDSDPYVLACMTPLVVREFREELERLQSTHSGRPEDEWRALYLLALEREQLVTLHYSGKILHDRVAALRAPPEVRRLVHHALHWASRDEDMHTVYARGVLFRRGERALAFRALMQQLGGLVAGWSSAVSQHVGFTQAPIARTLALFVSYVGLVAGKVPRGARKTLSHQSFAGFSSFNEEAEETAALCWERIADLSAEESELCRRVAADERNHARVFRAFRESFDESDTLRAGVTATSLAERLHDADPAFVPRDCRRGEHKLGSGADVVVCHDPDVSPRTLLKQAIETNGLLDSALAGRDRRRVVIKTEFMMSYDHRDRTTTVDPDLIVALTEMLRARGAEDVVFLETPNLFDRHFAGRSVHEIADYMGLRFPDARLVDASVDLAPHTFRRGLGQSSISRIWRDADVRISLAKMRTNPSFLVHLSLANLESLGQRIEEMLFADRIADSSTGLMMALDEFPCHLAVLDATHDVADGLTGILGTAQPRHPGRMYASEDAVALDWVATRHMGLKELPRSASCRTALDWFGDMRDRTKVIGEDTPIQPFINPHNDDARIFLSSLAYPVYSWLSDGGSLWMPKMDPRAFPLSRRENGLAFVGRRLLRRIFQFGSPVGEWE
jgi:uncharacterized protein (DUF362 family)